MCVQWGETCKISRGACDGATQYDVESPAFALHAAERSPPMGHPGLAPTSPPPPTNATCYDLTLNLFIAHLVLATNTSHVVPGTEGIDACSYFARAPSFTCSVYRWVEASPLDACCACGGGTTSVHELCSNDCAASTYSYTYNGHHWRSSDGICQDGGNGSVADICGLGSDCADCGPRYTSVLPPPPSPSPPVQVGGPQPLPPPSPPSPLVPPLPPADVLLGLLNLSSPSPPLPPWPPFMQPFMPPMTPPSPPPDASSSTLIDAPSPAPPESSGASTATTPTTTERTALGQTGDSSSSGGGSAIFIIVAVLAIVVVLLPLVAAVVVLRKKRHSGAEEEAPSRLAKDDGIEAVAVNLEMVSSVG